MSWARGEYGQELYVIMFMQLEVPRWVGCANQSSTSKDFPSSDINRERLYTANRNTLTGGFTTTTVLWLDALSLEPDIWICLRLARGHTLILLHNIYECDTKASHRLYNDSVNGECMRYDSKNAQV